jgi:hypothetical protein
MIRNRAKDRHAAPDHPLLVEERKLAAQISSFWEIARRLRDAMIEQTFASIHGADLWSLGPLLPWPRAVNTNEFSEVTR